MAKSQGRAVPPAGNPVPAPLVVGPTSTVARGDEQFETGHGSRPPNHNQRGRCFKCNDVGHYARNCPNGGRNAANTGIQADAAQNSRSNEAMANRRVTPVTTAYLPTRIGGRDCWCLLDSGSEVSIIPSRCITAEEVLPNSQELRAANGSEIEIAGEAVVELHLDANVVISSRFLVSHYVDEVMLGLDWLEGNECTWNFRSRLISVRGQEFKVFGAKPTWRIRRVILQEDVTLQPRTQQTVKAQTVYSRLSSDSGNWITESTQLRPGVRVARTLVRDASSDVLLPVMNNSETEVTLPRGTPLSSLEEVDVAQRDNESSKDEDIAYLDPLWNTVDDSVTDV